MKLLTSNSGSYPRVGDEPGQMRLRKAYNKWEVGNISDEEMERVYQDYTKEVIQEQEDAGIDVVTDGLLRWYGPLFHFARGFSGCEVDGLVRYFDTNFYVRQPRVVDEIGWEEPVVRDEFVSAEGFASVRLKPVVTGPFTLAYFSIDEFYGDFSELVMSFAKVVGEEVRELVKVGAEEIQIDEPAILGCKERFGVFSEGIEKVAEFKDDSQLDLFVYFGDSCPLFEDFQNLPVDLLGLDFTYSSKLVSLIEEVGCDKKLGMGMIDARNTKLENSEDILSKIERISPHIHSEEIYLNPSSGLEYLPRKKAFEKLKNMVRIGKKARGMIK